MKKTFLLSIALSSSLLAGDYGFRDYLTDYFKKNGGSMDYTALDQQTTVLKHIGLMDSLMDKYCTLQGGTLYGVMKHDLGVEQLPAHAPDLIASYAAMSKQERTQKLLSDSRVGGLWLSSEEKEFNVNFKNFQSLECRLPSGETLMTGKQKGNLLIAEHKPEKMSDFIWYNKRSSGVFTASKETSEEYKKRLVSNFPNYESYFDTFSATHKLNGNYRINDKFGMKQFVTGFTDMGDIGEINLFCEANGGRFSKDGVPFREFLKGVFNKHGWAIIRNDSGKQESPFSGNYTCEGGSSEFTVLLDNPYRWNDTDRIAFGYSLIKKGTAGAQVSPSPSQNVNAATIQKNQSASSNEEQIVRQIASSKIPFGKQIGANVISGYYNGTDAQGCDLVSLQKTVANMPVGKGRQDTFNYKVCNNQVIALGETGLPGVPRAKELDPIIAQVKSQCKAYGAYGSEYQGTIVSCRSLDQNHCNLEINIMQNGMLIDKRVENTCK